MSGFIAALKDIWRLAIPYFTRNEMAEVRIWGYGAVRMRERNFALFLLAAVVAFEIAFSYVAKQFNAWYNGFYKALQAKNYEAFLGALQLFTLIAVAHILLGVYKVYINQTLQIRWRRSMTHSYLTRWLRPAQHYRMQMLGSAADNPDQRISEDVHDFVGNTMSLGVGFFGNAVRLAIFIGVLWGLSETFPMQSFGFSYNIPGYLVWVSLAYALVGTLITHYIGRLLVNIEFRRQRYEADFRFAMARLRENSEQVALLHGESREQANLVDRYAYVFSIAVERIQRVKKMSWFTSFFGQFSVIFPFLMLGPAYFFGSADLGDMMQTVSTFGSVQDGMTWFIDFYMSLAAYRANVTRLTGFQNSADAADKAASDNPHVTTAIASGTSLTVHNLTVNRPNGQPITAASALTLAPGERVLVEGPSGSGKTSLLRALSGIWPFGSGNVDVPEGARVLVLPQRSYMPQGSLRQVLCYPGGNDAYADADVRETLAAVGLGHLVTRLDDADMWSNVLSGGEQQRVGVARALLMKPDFLFLDEATSALDAPSETKLQDLLKERLAKTAMISVAHKAYADEFHTRKVAMERNGEGRFDLAAGKVAAGVS